jgi:2-aminoethylphosphonate dioxygenase
MRHPVALSMDQVIGFDRDGFVAAPGFLIGPRLDEVLDWTATLEAAPDTPGRQMKYYEDSLKHPGRRVLNRLENFCPYHAGMNALATGGALIDAVGDLLRERAVLFKDKINFKLPGGDGFKPHQDAQAGWDTYADYFITALIALDEATEENGCLELAAGHHKRGLLGALWEPLKDSELAGVEFVPFPARPGDAIFFDSFAPHRSAPNMTDTPRRLLYITYNRLSVGDQRARYFADKRKSFPPDCEREPGKSYAYKV